MWILQTPFSPFQPPHCSLGTNKKAFLCNHPRDIRCHSPAVLDDSPVHSPCMFFMLLAWDWDHAFCLSTFVHVRCSLFCVILLPLTDSAWYFFHFLFHTTKFSLQILAQLSANTSSICTISKIFYHQWLASFPQSSFCRVDFKCSTSTLQNSSSSSSSCISVLAYEKFRTKIIVLIH